MKFVLPVKEVALSVDLWIVIVVRFHISSVSRTYAHASDTQGTCTRLCTPVNRYVRVRAKALRWASLPPSAPSLKLHQGS